MALFLGLFAPKRLIEQTNSQILHPEHRSGTTASFQDIFFLLVASLPPIQGALSKSSFVIASDRRKHVNL
jgi:hypothetical protein